MWKRQIGLPIFAGLTFLANGLLLVPCADGYVYGLNPSDGCEVIKLDCGGPLFATLSIFDDQLTIAVRVEDQANLICTSLTTDCSDWLAVERWRAKIESELVASPFVFEVETKEKVERNCVVAAKCGTVYLLDGTSGVVRKSREFPGEIFSSPVVTPEGEILVGCRDNLLYCLQI